MSLLSVKVDYIAAVRNAIKSKEATPSQAAVLAELAGADAITCHLREDRQFIRDRDFYILKEVVKGGLNLQIAPDDDLLERAREVKPRMVTLMPFTDDNTVLSQGIDFEKNGDRYANAAGLLIEAGIRVCYFVDPDNEAIRDAARVKADAVELNLHDYFKAKSDEEIESELNRLEQMTQLAAKLGMKVFGGNGLNYSNIRGLVELGGFDSFIIGYAIVSRAMMVGMDRAVRDMLDLLNRPAED